MGKHLFVQGKLATHVLRGHNPLTRNADDPLRGSAWCGLHHSRWQAAPSVELDDPRFCGSCRRAMEANGVPSQ